MESKHMMDKDLKVEIPTGTHEMTVLGGGSTGLTRQPSVPKNNCCLCSPTTHAGSFRCRLHRTPSLQRTKSMDSKQPSTTPS